MRWQLPFTCFVLVALPTEFLSATEIRGDYLEARTCDVYTGPCFANAEMSLAGKEAIMAWKVEEGTWKGVSLDGLGAALVVRSNRTLGDDGTFGMKQGKQQSVILVDDKATAEQHLALIDFVKTSNAKLSRNVKKIVKTPIELQNNYLTNKGLFSAGKLAKIETRAMRKDDCVCTNEVTYYQPFNTIENMSPAYSKTMSFQGEGLNSKWTNHGQRSAFLGTFRR